MMAKTQDQRETRGALGRLTSFARVSGRFFLTLGVIGGAGFAVQYGASELAQRAEAAPSPEAAPAIPIRAMPLRMESGYDVTRAFIGQVEAQKTVSLSFELSGRLAEVSVEEGESVTEGQVLAVQDTSLLMAERAQLLASKAAAEAQLIFAEQTLERNEELKERGFATQAGLDGALATRDELVGRIAEIEAGLANVDIRVEKSTIRAPFDGRVTVRSVDGGEALSPGQPVIGLVELRAPQVRVGVPLDLDEGRLEEASVEIGGVVHPATLIGLRPDIDPVTRTRTAIFAVESDEALAFGQTARLLLTERIDAEGRGLPVTSLSEGVRGQWTVLAVGPDDTVRWGVDEILHAESDRVFVRSAFPDGTRLIGEGPQRVTVGQTVVATLGE